MRAPVCVRAPRTFFRAGHQHRPHAPKDRLHDAAAEVAKGWRALGAAADPPADFEEPIAHRHLLHSGAHAVVELFRVLVHGEVLVVATERRAVVVIEVAPRRPANAFGGGTRARSKSRRELRYSEGACSGHHKCLLLEPLRRLRLGPPPNSRRAAQVFVSAATRRRKTAMGHLGNNLTSSNERTEKLKIEKEECTHKKFISIRKLGRRPICRCLFAVRGYIREVHNLWASICTSVIVHQDHLAVFLLGL